MAAKNKNITTFEEIKDQTYGPVGTTKRDDHDRGYEFFKIGVMIHEARLGYTADIDHLIPAECDH